MQARGPAHPPGQDPGGMDGRQGQAGIHQAADEQGHHRDRQGNHQTQLLAQNAQGKQQGPPGQLTDFRIQGGNLLFGCYVPL